MSTSHAIQILQRRCINVLATGLLEGERYNIEYAVDTGCEPADTAYATYHEEGWPVLLDTQHNPITLWRPGWYRLVSEGDLNEDARLRWGEPFDCSINANTPALILTPQQVAALFQDCDGIPLVPDLQLAQCSDIPTPEEIAGTFLDCHDNPLPPGAKLLQCSDQLTAENIAGVFQDCAGTPLVPNAQLVTCTDFGDAAGAPATSEAPELPTTLYGARTALLGQPVGWLDVGGKKIPYWT